MLFSCLFQDNILEIILLLYVHFSFFALFADITGINFPTPIGSWSNMCLVFKYLVTRAKDMNSNHNLSPPCGIKYDLFMIP